ncbi:MAG TPA: hypothetical protein DDZ83_15865 [Nitrospinae bacterium]|nr:hypothetical protein [Nitrospinota bacterium]
MTHHAGVRLDGPQGGHGADGEAAPFDFRNFAETRNPVKRDDVGGREDALAHHGYNGRSPGDGDGLVAGEESARLFIGGGFEKLETGNAHFFSSPSRGGRVSEFWTRNRKKSKWCFLEPMTIMRFLSNGLPGRRQVANY